MDTHFVGPAVNGYGATAVQRALQTIFGKATGTLTSDATAPANNSTVTIGGTTYTFKTAITAAAGDVLIGGSAAAALTNLKSAINHTGTPGTDYAAATPIDPNVVAGTLTATTLFVTAIVGNGAGNLIVTTQAGTSHTTWGATTLTGGFGIPTASGAGARRLLLRTQGAKFTQPLLVGLLQVQVTAFDGTAPEVAIISENLDGTGTTTERNIAAIVTGQGFYTRLITVDKNYYVQYTAATGSPTVGEIWSFARVAGIGYTS